MSEQPPRQPERAGAAGHGDRPGRAAGGLRARHRPCEVAESDDGDGDDDERSITDLVEQPAKVMRIGSMIRQLLEEVKAAPLDEASRNRLKEIHQASIKELEAGLAPELVEELERLSLPFTEDSDARPTPSCGSPRRSWSAGWRACSTASRPRSTPSRWRRGRSSSRCGKALPPGMMPQQAAQGSSPARTTASGPARTRAGCTSRSRR